MSPRSLAAALALTLALPATAEPIAAGSVSVTDGVSSSESPTVSLGAGALLGVDGEGRVQLEDPVDVIVSPISFETTYVVEAEVGARVELELDHALHARRCVCAPSLLGLLLLEGVQKRLRQSEKTRM